MTATVIATTRSGSRYVVLIQAHGVTWVRLPAAVRAEPMVGWLATPPRIVHGERLMLGDLQSTPVTRVSFLPGPEPVPGWMPPLSDEHDEASGAIPAPQAWSLRSVLGSDRH
jgi:hypothetical protein